MQLNIIFPDMMSTLQVTGCHFGVKAAHWHYPKHHHHLYELLYCQEGEATQTVNGTSIRICPGDWLLMKAGVRHETVNHSEKHFAFFNIHFDIDNQEMRNQLSALDYVLFPQTVNDSTRLPAYMKEIEKLMYDNILKETPLTSMGEKRLRLIFEHKIALQAYILLIICEIVRLQRPLAIEAAAHRSGKTMHETDTAHAIEERLQHLAVTEGSIAQIARELNLSRSQCSKIFTKIYGTSPRQYVIRLKMSRAKQLLVLTGNTIEAIAEELGYHSVSHFSRQFRHETGLSPNQFRPKDMTGTTNRSC